ncbi:hypothetical protein BR93DRAFT_131101 [Coniochaeta sp. PMI_546]|nr:hypothetical protein BR93DRAFT_131101 [Coniochaeta sp. PMI_546]
MDNTVAPAAISQLPSLDELDEKPWKFIGYPGFAAYLSSDDDFFLLRRFDRLHSRVLLKLQDDLTVLEDNLDALDSALMARDAVDFDNGSFRNDKAERRQLLEAIESKLNNYDLLLHRYLQIKTKPDAPKTNIRNVQRWLSNRHGAIHDNELRFLQSKDLITTSKEKSPLRRLFEQQILARTSGLFGIFSTGSKISSPESGLKTTVRGDDRQVDITARLAIFFAALAMLITPLWVLAPLSMIYVKLGVITAFAVFFLAVMNWGTIARPFEVLASTAGYCAVLVVFLQVGTTTL